MVKTAAKKLNPPHVGYWQSGFPNLLGNLSLLVFVLMVLQLAVLSMLDSNIFDRDSFRNTDERIPALGTRRVVDKAGVLTTGEVDALTRQIDTYEDASGGQMAVLIVKSLYGDAIEDFGLAVAEKWKIGQKGLDNGIVLVLSMEDRQSRLEIGYGLEGVINDARAGDILRGMAPAMRDGQYAAAISGAIAEVARMVLSENAPGVPEGLRYDPDADDSYDHVKPPAEPFGPKDLCLAVIVGGILFIVIAMITALIMIHPDVKKSIGLIVMIVVAKLFFKLLLAASRSGGRSGGRGGGGSRGRSGGGGGGFGGGGASGRW